MGRPRKNPDQPKAPAKPRKKADPSDKQKKLEDILYDCRNKLRGNANMTTKRDMLLTLVFLRFIGSRYNEQREKIIQDGCQRFGKPYEELSNDERDFVKMMLQRKQSYQKDGVFCLKDLCLYGRLAEGKADCRHITADLRAGEPCGDESG